LIAGIGGTAAAQPGPAPTPPPPTDTFGSNEAEVVPPEPPPEVQPPPQPEPQPRPMPVVTQTEAAPTDRPSTFAIGLGLGYGLPTSLETPNRTSARLRLASGLTFEPLLSIANSKETTEVPMMPESEDKITEFGLAALVRYPLITHGHVDLEALASAGFTNTKSNPDGDFNTTTTNTFGIGWGVGIGYWLSRHWQLSMSVTNPLVQYSSTKQQVAQGISNENSETTIGVIFTPQVSAMIHLYN
jgi:hypothetical protein